MLDIGSALSIQVCSYYSNNVFRLFVFFLESAAFRSIVFRYACAPAAATRSYITTICVPFCFFSFFVCLFFGDVAFPEYDLPLRYIVVSFLYGEDVVRFPSGCCFSTL